MRYEIFGENLPAVSITLNRGESIVTQSGGMSWMTSGIEMDTNMRGGFLKGLGRMFSGESLFMATYTAAEDNQNLTIASSFPGEIRALQLNGSTEYICQKDAFLCAETGVDISAHVVKGLKAGLFGGEGFILQKLGGTGTAWLELDGSIREITLAPGETIKADSGSIAFFESSVTYTAEMVKGFKNILFGGEGLFLSTLTGPGKVYLQTLSLPRFAGRLIPFLPRPTNSSN
ncbi:MAG TPA: TIGR00266 family protein [Candidatus Ornithomonoglobus intestinigallinarum]|uniref:TIGR00266 family protein n=1 Tax=Candidatus Ornithomonoglobus intestinigallinarum TaxID=2840894 RepID=A0A9D1H5Q9_9FIRM|nr:TIGR00266 family protein [Candidatus Ornithomonoglobus intestinigallinarum]